MTVPEPIERDFSLYHWSPSTRRNGIGRYGLVSGKRSVCGKWRPPYVAFGLDPHAAWQMSGEIHPEIPEWDLWMTHSEELDGFEVLPYDDMTPKEIRVYHRIPGAALFFVGTRQQTTGQRGK